MRKRRNVFKSAFAILLTIATVLNTGFSTIASEIVTDDGIVVNNDIAEESYDNDTAIDEQEEAIDDLDIEVVADDEDSFASDEEDFEEEEIEALSDDFKDEIIDEDILDEEIVDEEILSEEDEEDFEEAEELKDGELSVKDNGIFGSGYEEISVYVNTEKMSKKHNFRIEFNGPASASYSTFINDDLDKTNSGYYDFTDLEGGEFSIRAYSDDNVILTYSYNEDGYPMISVESIDEDKILDTKTITSNDGTEISAITGSGYESIDVEFVTDDLSDKVEYTLYVESVADATVDGKSAIDGIDGLNSDTDYVTVENLDAEEFLIYVVAEDDTKLETNASVLDVENGRVSIYVSDVATKTVYEYEDDKVYVRARIEKADAIPDDAFFSVELVDDIEEYLEVMNEGSDTEKYSEENTLIYDIGFYTDETKSEEIEPEEGSVSVSIKFKKDQINKELATDFEVENVEITHFEEDGNEVEAVVVESIISSDNKEVDFTVDSFSKFAVYADGKLTMDPGTSRGCDTVLGDAYYYGIVGNYVHLDGHLESNIAAGVLAGNANIASPKNEGGAGVSYVGSYTGSKFFMDKNANSNGGIRLYSTKDAVAKFGEEMASRIANGTVTVDYSMSQSEIEAFVSKMVNKVEENSELLMSEENAVKYSSLKSHAGTDGYIDLTNCEDGTYYINYDLGEWSQAGSTFKYKITSGQNLVLNIPDTTVYFCQYQLMVDGKNYCPQANSDEEILFEKIIYNCPNATKASTSTPVTGTFLTPKAGFYNNSVAAGFVVANRIEKIGGSEWHCISKNIPVIEDDRTELEIPVIKNYVDNAGNDIDNANWPSKGFKFTISKYPCNDPGDVNDGNVEKDINYIPDIIGTNEVTIYGNTPNHTATFGKLVFNGSDVYNDSRSHKSYSFGDRDVRYRAIMYKIVEENTGESGVVYDNETPVYMKIFVNSERISLGNNSYKYYVWTEVKTARTVLKYECKPEMPAFTNHYENQKSSVILSGKKTINGSDSNVPNKFTFKLYQYTKNDQWGPEKASVTNNGSSFSFPEIELDFKGATGYNTANSAYSSSATEAYFYYKIVEEPCSAPYEYDASTYIAKVTLKKNGNGFDAPIVEYYKFDKGTVVSCKNYPQLNKDDPNKGVTKLSSMTFDNKYDSIGYLRFNALKSLTNADLDSYNGKFSFEFTTENDPLFKQGTVRKLDGSAIQPNHADGTGKNAKYVTFDTLTYYPSDIKNSPYIYHIKEVIPADKDKLPGITYDTSDYKIVVYLSDNGDGSIKCVGKVYKDGTYVYEYENSTIKDANGLQNGKAADDQPMDKRPLFTNVYQADGDLVISVNKVFAHDIPTAKTFYFDLTKPDGTVVTKTLDSVGTVSFDTIKYTLEDLKDKGNTYTYKVKERHPDGAVLQPDDGSYLYEGIKYDGKEHTIVVTISDNGTGKLTVTKTVDEVQTDDASVTFTNDYQTEKVSTEIEGTKTLHGKKLAAGDFSFKIEATSNAENCVITDDTVENDADGKFKFTGIEFNKKGTYTFKITEVPGNDTKMTYSADEYVVTVVVDDNKVGKLVVSSKTITKAGSEVSSIGFVNTYNGDGEVTLVANKNLTGRKLENEQFTFEITDANKVSLGSDYVTKNAEDGSISFNKIKYSLSDLADGNGGYKKETTKDYYIHEVVTNKVDGYTYDEEYKKVSVKLTLNDDGSISAEPTYEGGKAEFNNTYITSGDIELNGNKQLVGRKYTDSDADIFKAVLKDSTGKVLQTVPITKKQGLFGGNGGEFKFEKLTFNAEGTYVYTVEEIGEAENVTNDSAYTVTITATDDGKGHLTCVPTYSRGTGITFVNTYNTPGKATIKANKSLDFGTLEENQFTFKLFDKQKNDFIDTAKNNASGSVVFNQIDYTRDQLDKDSDGNPVATNFEYQISEVDDKKDGYTYSTALFDVVVTVTPNDDELTTEVVYKDSTGAVVDEAEVIFENSYKANGTVQFEAKKTLNGRAMTANQFAFELRDEKGDLVKLYDEAGNVTFEGIAYSPAADAGEAAKVIFPALTFTQEDLDPNVSRAIGEDGTFAKYYTIREVVSAGDHKGYTYDKSVYNVQVTLKDNGKGEITTDWTAYKAGEVTEEKNFFAQAWEKLVAFFTGNDASKNVAFVNNYAAEGQVVFSAHKTVEGATLVASDFSFNLSGKAEDGSDINQTLSCGTDGNVTFSGITYTKPGTYTYTIKEVIPENDSDKKPGYTYDETEYTAEVTVTDDGEGVLNVATVITAPGKTTINAVSEVKPKDNGGEYGLCTPAAAEFVNTYEADDVELTIGGTKTLTGKKLTAEEFTFNMVSAEGNSKAYSETAKNAADGSFSFPKITYTFADMKDDDNTYASSKTFAYVVTEEEETEEGVTYSKASYDVVVEVTNANGKLSTRLLVNDVDKSATPLQAVEFVNTYDAENSVSFTAQKKVSGTDKADKEFKFILSGDATGERTVKANEIATFGPFDYKISDLGEPDADGNYAKTFNYTVIEKEEDLPGYDYSKEVYTVKVDVTSTGNGVVNVEKTITNSANEPVSEPMIFTNTYTADGNVEIEGYKTFTSTKNKLADNEFTFILEDEEGNKIAEVGNGYALDVKSNTKTDYKPEGKVEEFKFVLSYDQTDLGKHQYVVRELVHDTDRNIKFDTTAYNVEVNVTDLGNGKLDCQKTISGALADGDKVWFHNYEIDDNQVVFTAKKKLTGMTLSDNMFTFTLKDENGELIDEKKNVGEDVTFDPITYSLSDLEGESTKTFKYTVQETVGTNVGIKYSDELYTAVVTLKLDDGQLLVSKEITNKAGEVVSSAETDGMVFENKYESDTKVRFSGHKILTGFDKRDEAHKGTYTFELYDETGSKVDSKVVTGEGDFEFDEITFNQDDYMNLQDHQKHYTVKEVVTDENKQANVSYDATVYAITVELSYAEDGKLQATVSTDAGVDAQNKGLVFENIYSAEGLVPFAGTKKLTGANLKDGDYSFALYEEGNDKAIDTAVNVGNKFSFDSITYTQDSIGTHTYIIKETPGTVKGMNYDGSEYKVVVDVADKADGSLEITKTTYKDGVEVSKEIGNSTDDFKFNVEFENEYKASGSTELEGTKIFENRKLKDDEFGFILKDAEGNTLDTVRSSADGSFKFDGDYFKFDQEVLKNVSGTYEESVVKYYTVEEVVGSEECIDYSDAVYAVALTITDKHDETLDVKQSIKLTNASAKTGVVGLIDKIKSSIVGSSDALEFTNTYHATGEWDPEGWKELVGRDMKDGEFSFKIQEIDQKRKQVDDHEYTVVNEGNHIKFSSKDVKSEKGDYFLQYSIEDLDGYDDGRIYLYQVSEVTQSTDDNGIKYDPYKYVITVTVTDNGDGTLHVQVNSSDLLAQVTANIKDQNILDKVEESGALFAFVNEFDAEGEIELAGTKKIEGRNLEASDENRFSFTITEEKFNNVAVESPRSAQVGNTANAKDKGLPSLIKFDAANTNGILHYGLDDIGVHTYIIDEEVYNENGVTYDQAKYRVTVDVELQTLDNGDYSKELATKVTGVDKIYSANNVEIFDIASGDYFVFNNTYNATGDIQFAGLKNLVDATGANVGTAANLTNKYSFTMTEYTDEARTVRKPGYVDSVSTDAQGRFTFETLNYSQADLKNPDGSYETTVKKYYRVKENLPSRIDNRTFEFEGVVYDTTEYDITVTITNNGTENLVVTSEVTNVQTGEKVAKDGISFTNKTVETVVLEGDKIWHDNVTDASSRPDVRINLYSSAVGGGNSVIATYVIKAPNTHYYFDTDAAGKALPAYDASGRKITYRVEEEDIAGYTSEKVGDNFHNTAGDILIRKVDDVTGETLAGATLAIVTTTGTEVERWVSTESAHVVTSALTPGSSYILREISAPEGYELAADVSFVVPSDGSEIVVTMRDVPVRGSVRLTKQDASTRASLAGAEFALYNYDGTRIYATGTSGSYRYTRTTSNGVFVTGSTGNLTISDLPYGTYYFVETKAPAGYELSSERVSFSVTTNGELVEVTYLNTKATGSVRLRKINATGSRSLAGAVFELYVRTPQTLGQAATSTIFSDAYYRYGTYRTNAAGEIYVDGLPWDDYYFIEVEAPTGYQISTDGGYQLVYTFTVDSTATTTIDLGGIINTPEEETPPTPPTTTTTTRATRSTTPSGVLGERRTPGGVMSNVLGVRAKPTSGVLGERVGPVTGDFSNIALWVVLLAACMAMIITMLVKTGKNDKKAKAKK